MGGIETNLPARVTSPTVGATPVTGTAKTEALNQRFDLKLDPSVNDNPPDNIGIYAREGGIIEIYNYKLGQKPDDMMGYRPQTIVLKNNQVTSNTPGKYVTSQDMQKEFMK